MASQNLAWHSFEADELAAVSSNSTTPASERSRGFYDEQFELVDQGGEVMRGVQYRVLAGAQVLASGVTDMQGRTQRIKTSNARDLRLDIVHKP
ncbi:hypothetical protein [Paraburkholderia bannensis]|uniref:hypothetical protein n=1 Tax=Paraburkholderia bannensis TaxID=765414 RepID=UPI002AC33AE4|nr:hypothetical protein [Paraburkholderia bannensis]